MSKLLTVFGATGNQGGSIIKYVLAHPDLSKIYSVRAVTRDPSKASSQALQELGAEVVKGDLSDPSTIQAAIKGSYAVFGVTNFWEHLDGGLEERQGKSLADAAVAQGAELFIWSSLPHVAKVTGGHLKNVAHFDHKANVEEYIRTLPIKSAFFWPAFFASNLTGQFGPQKSQAGDGTFTLANVWSPTGSFPIIDISDTGKFVAPALKDPAAWNHKRIYAASGFYTPEQIASTISEVTGKTVKYQQLPDAVWKGFLPMPEPLNTEVLENMVLMRDYNYFGPEGKGPEEELKDTLAALEEQPRSFEEFVKATEWTALA